MRSDWLLWRGARTGWVALVTRKTCREIYGGNLPEAVEGAEVLGILHLIPSSPMNLASCRKKAPKAAGWADVCKSLVVNSLFLLACRGCTTKCVHDGRPSLLTGPAGALLLIVLCRTGG